MRSGYSTTTPKKKKYYAKPGQLLPSTLTLTPWLNIHDLKIMLCIWWDQKGLVYYAAEIWRFHYGQSVSATIDSLSCALRKKRPEYEQRQYDKVFLLHDNARAHVAKVIKKYLETQMGCFTAFAIFSGYCSF